MGNCCGKRSDTDKFGVDKNKRTHMGFTVDGVREVRPSRKMLDIAARKPIRLHAANEGPSPDPLAASPATSCSSLGGKQDGVRTALMPPKREGSAEEGTWTGTDYGGGGGGFFLTRWMPAFVRYRRGARGRGEEATITTVKSSDRGGGTETVKMDVRLEEDPDLTGRQDTDAQVINIPVRIGP